MVNEQVDEETNGADVAVNAFGVKANVKNVKSLNTVCTIAVLVVVSVLGYAFYVHAGETKDAGRELVGALKEMTQVVREANCLNTLPPEKRPDPDYCRRAAR